MSRLASLTDHLHELLGDSLLSHSMDLGELTLEIDSNAIKEVCVKLRDDEKCRFDQLIDLCGMDYSTYGDEGGKPWPGSRFAVVYHLLSLEHNNRTRLRIQLEDDMPTTDSVIDVWAAADWFEREAFDLYGIIFANHPDLRRLLTDYGFIGHPFRKDFPLSGHVEMHYDEEQRRVVYKPVTVEDRILVPKTIRKDTFAGTRKGGAGASKGEDG
ncbi:MAG: NADH-quinone oxidoreductase subunit C [Gammaproteobacteria bacterium]